MKYLFVITLFFSLSAFAQTTKPKEKISIQFEHFKDTVFTGFQNMITLRGINDFTNVTVEITEGPLTTCGNIKNCYYLPPPEGKKSTEIIVKDNKKEIYRRKVVITSLEGRQLEIVKKKKGIK